MPGRRLLRTLILFGSLAVGATASATAPRAPIRWSSAQLNTAQPSATNTHGKKVSLGTDPHLQSELLRLLKRSRPISGAATLVDARTGQVLAAAEIGKRGPKSLLFDPVAPAASVFKIVTTAALFERTSVTPLTRVCTLGGKRDILREHLVPARGPDVVCTKFAHALGVSRNAVYAQLANEKLMRDDLVEIANALGFNSPLLLDANGSVGTLEVPYNDLSFARTAAGFENSRLSVFGGAQIALMVASGGVLKPMHFQDDPAEEQTVRVISPRTARRLRDAMEVTIHSGTARDSFVNERGRSRVGPVQVAGKTGTLKPTSKSPTSSWFVGFAPSENPRVVVSVLLQNPDKWVRKGHQLGRDLLQAYLIQAGVKGIKME